MAIGEISIDPVAVAVALVTTLLGPQLAAYVGPYVVIGAAGLTGAAFALGRREPTAKLGAGLFLVVMVGFSMFLTVALTEVAAAMWPAFGARWMLAPVALAIGYLGDDWGRLLKMIGERLGRLLEKRTGGQ